MQHNDVKRKCSIETKCGGCQYLGIPYPEQLKKKELEIEKYLSKYVKPEKIIGMDNPYFYRNKVTATFGRKKDGTIYSGIYEEKSHNILQHGKCYLENELAQDIIAEVTKMVKSFKWTVYSERSGFGLVRHLMVRTAHASGEVMVILVTTSHILPSAKNFSKALKAKFPQITTIIQNVNDKNTTMVLGNRDIVLYGKGFIEDVLCGCRFKLSPQSFYQINSVQTELLYNKAMEYAALTERDTVLDTYCGIGTIGIIAAKEAGKVIGVELNKEAVKDATVNADKNSLKNIKFYNADATKFMLEASESDLKPTVVFMDPPRSGSTEEFLDALIRMKPERIVYISCGPESLKRDLQYITRKSRYQVRKAVAVDMFPMTTHVECVCLLSKVQK